MTNQVKIKIRADGQVLCCSSVCKSVDDCPYYGECQSAEIDIRIDKEAE